MLYFARRVKLRHEEDSGIRVAHVIPAGEAGAMVAWECGL
jgi:hypothetical protein